MIYAFGKMPKRANDDLLEFIRNNEGLFVLPEAFLDIYGFSADDLADLTQDSKRIIVAGTGSCIFNYDEKALLISDGKYKPITYRDSRQHIPIDESPRVAEVRVCSDISHDYMDDGFHIILHPSSGPFYVDRYHSTYPSTIMQSKPVVSSSYNEGKILIGGKNVGDFGKTGKGIEYAYLDSLDLQKYL